VGIKGSEWISFWGAGHYTLKEASEEEIKAVEQGNGTE